MAREVVKAILVVIRVDGKGVKISGYIIRWQLLLWYGLNIDRLVYSCMDIWSWKMR